MSDIDLDRADPGFKHEVARRRGAEGIKRCYACGACSARCPVGELNPDFDPRRLIRLVVLGLRDEVLSSPLLWVCSTCYTCQETCPEGVDFTEVLFVLKNMAVEAGCFPPTLGAQVELLKNHGRLYEITDFENEKRAELGLPPLDERPDDFLALLKDFQPETKGDA
ncbi:MAG: 4Fe-4S dicluster domain-containing protein [Proteobacteria bacterium]|nr:4Fe-4S dicluster domain-containing protein [Pseudomonadota bacterium]